ncbi:anti-sigma factor [Nonomuraea sp. NBC_01738]|uniref:anti-sigma factor n=1 Tax=Nonomuraea sp. NBC_01738 TaxID=2976003 RepID=UPI002E0E9CA7|nr:anti-sigma factor [Nonomuraea sp. NBC_01738]
MSTPPDPDPGADHTLAGAYALHALTDAQARLYERHLAQCPPCAGEVGLLRETAARLAGAVAAPPPPALRPRLLATAAFLRRPARASAHRRDRVWKGLAVAAAAAAVALGVLYGHGAAELDRQREIAEVVAAPDVVAVREEVRGGGSATVIWSRTRRRLVLSTDGLPKPPGRKVYEVWLMGADGARPAGFVGAGAGVMVAGPRDDDSGLGVTLEPEGGSDAPSGRPILLAELG